MINFPLKSDIFDHIYHQLYLESLKNLCLLKLTIQKKLANLHVILFYLSMKNLILNLKKYLSNSEFSYINDLLKTSDLKKNMFVFEVNSKKKIILISIKKDLKSFDIENLGAEFYGRINYGKNSEYFINSDSVISKHENFIGHFLHGLKLKSYEFNKYKTKKETRLISINVLEIKINLNSKSIKI